MLLSVFAKVLLFALILLGVFPGLDSSTTLYFTNDHSIEKIQNNSATPVIEVAMAPQALDCNSCDQRIYWVSKEEKAIKRGFPSSDPQGSNVEVILDLDLINPQGLAVDWRGDNVYFTDGRGKDGIGRVEVISCDGKRRKVLFNDLEEAGPIAVDPVHGHMYWAVLIDIWIADMDGSNREMLIRLGDDSHVEDIAIDHDNNLLYWIDKKSVSFSKIYHANLDGTNVVEVEDHILNHTTPSGVSVSHNTLYWTQQQVGTLEGAIYSYDLLNNSTNGQPSLVLTDDTLNPHDISSFASQDITGQVVGGCSDKNNGCSDFCFTVPMENNSFSSPTSKHRCGCPTGLTFRAGSTSECNEIPDDFLLFIQVSSESIGNVCPTPPANKSLISMLSLDTDVTIPVVLPIKIDAESSDLAFDLSNSLVYWTEHNPPAIKRSQLDGTNVETVVSKDLLSPSMIALDSSHDTLFWTDSILDRVEVMSVRGSLDDSAEKRRVLATTGLMHPFGIALNELTGDMYWTDQSNDGMIQRATLNGTIDDSFQVSGNVIKPGAIATKLSANEIYWAETQEGHWSIRRVQVGGGTSGFSEIDLWDKDYGGDVVGMDFFLDKLYFTERFQGRILSVDLSSINLNSNPLPVVVLEGVDNPRGIVAIHNSDEPINKGCRFNYGGCADICVAGEGDDADSRQCICRENYQLVGDTQCQQERNPLLLLSNGSSVVILEKEDWQDTTSGLPDEHALPIPAGAMDADYTEDILYWISTVNGWIYHTRLNRGNYTDSVSEPLITCCYAFSDIAVDWWGRNLYWIDNTHGILGVAKLNGQSVQVIAEGLNDPVNLIAHPELRSLYFLDNSTSEIWSIHMDGNISSLSVIFHSLEEAIIGLTLDPVKNLLFWSTDVSKVYEYDLGAENSAGPKVVISDPNLLTLLTYSSKDVFMLDMVEGEIKFVSETDFALSSATALWALDVYGDYDDLVLFAQEVVAFIRDMLFIDASTQPGTHECTTSNGECKDVDSTLCIVTGPHSHECRCSPTQYLDLHTNDFGASQCHTAESMLVMSTPQQILYLPLRDPPYLVSGSSCPEYRDPPISPQALPFGPLGNVTAVAFDPVHDSIVWYDRDTGAVSRADRASSAKTKLADVPLSSIPRSLAYDWKGGQIFVVDQLQFQIDMYTVNNVSSAVLNQIIYIGDKTLNEPVVVAVNSRKRELYFADKYLLTIMKVDLNTLEVSRFLPDTFSKRDISQLAVDELNGIVYWYDDISMAVEMYRIQEQTSSEIIQSAPQHVSSLAATNVPVIQDVSMASMLYWYNRTDHSIYWYNGNSVNRLLVVDSKFEDVTAMAAFDLDFSMMLPVSSPCAEADRPCSHVCVPSQANAAAPTCTCTPNMQLDDDGSNCSPSNCSSLSAPCNSTDTCIPVTLFCDGLEHCPDGSDEANCLCTDSQFYCYSSEACIEELAVCNKTWECPNGEDEADCCDGILCPLLSNGGRMGCLREDFVCDVGVDCVDGEDEMGCTGPSASTDPSVPENPSSSPTPSPTSSSSSEDSVLHAVLFGLPLLLVILIILVCFLTFYYRRTRKKNTLHFPENSSFQSSTSPQPSNNRSDITSEFSIKTVETGSTHVERSSGVNGNPKRLSTYSTDPSNPPNSPINTPHSVACLSFASSRNFSEYDPGVPPVPNPSMNYDAYSDRFSSVSQIRIPATIPAHSNNTTSYPRRNHNGLPAYPQPSASSYVGAAPNGGNFYYSTGGCYPPGRYLQQHPPDHEQLDNISESTVSLSTFHPDLAADNTDYTDYTVTSFCDPSANTVELHHPYDEAPPPSPVTEYCLETSGHDQ